MSYIAHFKNEWFHWPENRLTQIGLFFTALIPALMVISHGIADGALSLVALMFLGKSAWHKDWAWTKERWFLLALLVWGWLIFISFFAAVDSGDSFGRALPWIRFIVFVAALKNWILKDDKYKKTLAFLVGLTLSYIILDTWFQFITGSSFFGNEKTGPRLTGPFDGLVVGTYSSKLLLPVAGAICAFFFLFIKKTIYQLLITTVVAGIIAITILITGERAAFFNTIVALTLFFILSVKGNWSKKIIIMILSAGLLGLFVYANPEIKQRIVHSTIDRISDIKTNEYGVIWQNGLTMAADHPMTGAGLKNYRQVCLQGEPYQLLRGRDNNCGMHPHNVYIEWMAEAGLPSIFLFIILVFTMVVEIKKAINRLDQNMRIYALGSALALVVFLMPLFPSMSLFSNWNAILFWYALGWAFSFTSVRQA